MIKLIAIDMDGTLLNDDKKITQENKDAIKEAVQKGVKVVICTGRPCEGITKTLDELEQDKEDRYVVSFNGSIIKNVTKDTVITVGGLDGSDVHYLYDLSKKFNVNIHAFSENRGLITPKANEHTDIEANINEIEYSLASFEDVDPAEKFIKIMMVDKEENLDRVVENLSEEVYEKYSVLRSTPYFLEFLNPDVNKGEAVKKLAEILDINKDEVMCIGDAGNDLAMIEYAGVGVAMENGFDEVKAAATFITKSNEESGVAFAIRKYLG